MWLFKRSLYLINQIHSICYCKIAYFTRKDTKGVIRSRKSKKDWPHNSYKNKMNCELILTYDTPALRQSGSRNLTGQKMLPTIWGTYMKLVTKYKISAPSIVAEKNATKNEHICSMCLKINKVGKQEVGIWRVQKRYPQYGIPIWPNITCLPSTVTEKNATKNILDGRKDGREEGRTYR